jgi:methyltransferase (TIGR00027 family)
MPEEADWNIAARVVLIALWAAGIRAIESCHPAPLVTDPYAAAFVRAAASRLPSPIPTTREEADRDPSFPWLGLATYIGVRSRFFDAFFDAVGEVGIRQVVILGAGLDTRAFRLDWPPGTAVYEVDAPLVIAFKDDVLGKQDAVPRCARRTVACNPREDWPSALRQAGFDPASPTAWLTEGLFPHLPDDEKQALLDRTHGLSAAGSRLALEHFDTREFSGTVENAEVDELLSRFDEDITATWASAQEHDPVSWLNQHGWAVSASPATTVARVYGRSLDGVPTEVKSLSLLITASQDTSDPHDPAQGRGNGG